MPEIVFGYSAESVYNFLTPAGKNSICKIYSLLPELAERHIARVVDNTGYPTIYGYEYEGVGIRFIVKPCRTAIIIEIRCVTL